MWMRQYRGVYLGCVMFAATAIACGSQADGDDDDNGAPTSGLTGNTASGVGGTQNGSTSNTAAGTTGATGSGNGSGTGGSANGSTNDTSSTDADGSSSTNGGTTNGGTTSGGTTFDGGKRPLSEEELEELEAGSCAGWSAEGESIPSVLQLVVDVSSSMSQQAPGTNDSKWEVTRDALLEAIVGVNGTGLPGSVAVGMLFYPNVDGVDATPGAKDIDYCVNTEAMVPAAPLGAADGDHRNAVRQGIENVQLETSTPTYDAFSHALNFGLLPAELPGEKFMLLITDGQPTLAAGCRNDSDSFQAVNPDPIVDLVDAAWRLDIQTFLIGSPGSEDNRPWMSEAAVLGGTAWDGCEMNGPEYCHMDMTEATNFSEALRQGLAAVIGALSTCTYSFPEPPMGRTIDANEINVVVGSDDEHTLIVRDDIGDCTEGWQLTQDNRILLCPTTCADVQIDPNITLDVTFGCESLNLPLE